MLLEHCKENEPFCCVVRLAFMAGIWLRMFGGGFWSCCVFVCLKVLHQNL